MYGKGAVGPTAMHNKLEKANQRSSCCQKLFRKFCFQSLQLIEKVAEKKKSWILMLQVAQTCICKQIQRGLSSHILNGKCYIAER